MFSSPGTDSSTIAILVTHIVKLGCTRPLLVSFVNDSITALRELTSDEPILSLFGWTAPKTVTALGICAPASATPAKSDTPIEDNLTVVHVLERSGQAVTLLFNRDDSQRFGPTTQPQHGRVPDVCRRALTLATPPPSHSMTDFVIATWLEVLARQVPVSCGSIDTNSHSPQLLTWEDILRLHPATNSSGGSVTPASLARATTHLGDALDWDRFRIAVSKVGGFPFGKNACAVAEWMDSGMFSRWAMDLLLPQEKVIVQLESRVEPEAFSKLVAAVELCQ